MGISDPIQGFPFFACGHLLRPTNLAEEPNERSSVRARPRSAHRPRRDDRLSAASSRTTDLTNPTHFFWALGQNPDASATANSAANDLVYHGGNAGSGAIGVEQKPAVYLIWRGPQWAQGFQTEDTNGSLYSSKTLQAYLQSFFQNVGRSGWANIQTQYCNGALPGSTSCVGGTGYVTNPNHQLKGVWTDPTPVPDDIIALGLAQNLVDDPIAQEAMRASAPGLYV